MNKIILWTLFLTCLVICCESKKTSKSRNTSSGRGSSRKYNSPAPVPPTSFSHPQPSAPKPSLFGWQEKPAQRTHTYPSKQQSPSNGQDHSYPSSNTGLSGGNSQKQIPANQQPPPRSNVPLNSANQPAHSYPSSNGLSGAPQPAHGYPAQQNTGHTYPGAAPPPSNTYSGVAGSPSNTYPGAAPPPYQGSRVDPNRPYSATGGSYPTNNFGTNYHHPQGPPPPYTPNTNLGPSYGNYGGFGGHSPYNSGYGPQMPGYFGNVNSGKGFGGMSKAGSALTGVGIAGAGVGTILTGLALWNLARSTGSHHHTVIYDNRGQPVAVAPNNDTAAPAVDPILGDLVNCTLTISTDNATEILAIPCAIATSFTPEADVKDVNSNNDKNDNTKCIVTVVTKVGKEFTTTIPCSVLLNTAAENNVTEPVVVNNETTISNDTIVSPSERLYSDQPSEFKTNSSDIVTNSTLNCTPEPGDVRDPINPCFAVTTNLTVQPLLPFDQFYHSSQNGSSV